jgi:hypothetical protein
MVWPLYHRYPSGLEVGIELGCQGFIGQHVAQDFFQSHCMAAALPVGKKVTGALPSAVPVFGGMGVILAVELNRERGELYPLPFFGIAFCLLNFAD